MSITVIFPDYLALLKGAGASDGQTQFPTDGPTDGPTGASTDVAPSVVSVNNTVKARGTMWPFGYGVRVTLTAIDPDGDVDVNETEWVAAATLPLVDVVVGLAAHIEAQPHFRADIDSTGIVVTVTDPDYSGQVSVELIVP